MENLHYKSNAAEIRGRKKLNESRFGSASHLYLPSTLAALLSLQTAHLIFTFWNKEITELLEDWGFFPFREHTWQSQICVLDVLNCSKLSDIFRQKSSRSHNNCRLNHTSYPKAIIKLWSVIILFIYHGTTFLWWSGGLVTHMVATNLHHFKVLLTVLWCRGKLYGRLLRERSSLAASTGVLLVKKRVKRKIK